jgi:pyruvate/2-oxoglutarate dehydrogenase complex dihydrolipoamide dehydrogenase (E3) component
VVNGVDVPAALAWRDFMVSDYRDAGQVAWAESAGIDILRGTGRLDGPGAVEVDARRYTAEHVVIATGSEPVTPPLPGLERIDGLWHSREATSVREVPRRLLVLGAGPVGIEMAQAMARLGASVAVVGERVLPREPAPLGDALADALGEEGIELALGQRPSAAGADGDQCLLSFPDGTELRGDRLLVATGRRPRVDGIGLESVGIEAQHGIPVDERMAAGERLWAIGDVTGQWPMTYVGKYQGRVAAANIRGREARVDYRAVPRVVFTDPQAASVGAAEGPLTATVPLAEVARTSTYTRAYADREDFLTLVSDGEILTGAYALGPEAGEWLQQATLAIRARIPLDVLRDTIQPFPTFSEAFLYALQALGAPVPA